MNVRMGEIKLELYPDKKVRMNHGINATPDGDYAKRILEAYLYDASIHWNSNTDGTPDDDPFFKTLNDLQDKRTDELKAAIKKLEKL